ncbi:response regulator transcription factor [Bacillus sp. FSL K6-3431]|uniref:response regulator transcription factor n=1 Tax=Bacillus sp. FSL K6-3431 TaxID=2921500 RepID=UPI0030F70F19
MWKLVIADDEARIRRGLKNIIPWKEWNIEVVGEAEDGLSALEMATDLQPDMLFVDINMPFMDGLELVAKLKEQIMDCIIIIITGHDEFSYAQKSIKLNVFDYLLKPVVKGELEEVVGKAIDRLRKNQEFEERNNWTENQVKRHSMSLRDSFLRNWIQGSKTEEEVIENLKHFTIKLPKSTWMMAYRIVDNIDLGKTSRVWDKGLLEFSARNIIEETLAALPFKLVFSDGSGLIIVVIENNDQLRDIQMMGQVKERIESLLEKLVISSQKKLIESVIEFKGIYSELVANVNKQSQISPIVALAKKYIDQQYHQPRLSLKIVANEVKISPTYLSKQLKKELGLSFIDYLSEVRIKKAAMLMNDPSAMIYEVAEKVGYNSQHYFSNAFKKVTGSSPLHYRKGNRI